MITTKIAETRMHILQCRKMEQALKGSDAGRYAGLLRKELEAYLEVLELPLQDQAPNFVPPRD